MERKKITIFPGSFNPFTIGHLSIFKKAERIFGNVIIAVGEDPNKEKNINRIETIKIQLPGKVIESYKGFLVDYIYDKEVQGYDVTVVRGLRNELDLRSDIHMLRVLEDQKPDINMVFIACDREYEHISSSMVKTMEKIQAGSASEYLAKPEML